MHTCHIFLFAAIQSHFMCRKKCRGNAQFIFKSVLGMQAQPKLLPRMNKIAVLDFFDQGIPTRVQESRKILNTQKLYGIHQSFWKLFKTKDLWFLLQILKILDCGGNAQFIFKSILGIQAQLIHGVSNYKKRSYKKH